MPVRDRDGLDRRRGYGLRDRGVLLVRRGCGRCGARSSARTHRATRLDTGGTGRPRPVDRSGTANRVQHHESIGHGGGRRIAAGPEPAPRHSDRFRRRCSVGGAQCSSGGDRGLYVVDQQSPTSVGLYAPIPDSSEARCSGTSVSGTTLSVVSLAWAKRNVLALVIGSGLAPTQVESIAAKQDAALPAGGVDRTSGDSSSGDVVVGVIVLIVALALVVGVVVWVLVARQRRRQRASLLAGGFPMPMGSGPQPPYGVVSARSPAAPLAPVVPVAPAAPAPAAVGSSSGDGGTTGSGSSPAAAPGWYPIAGDPHHVGYWDGNRWSAQRRWDGAAWTDAPG